MEHAFTPVIKRILRKFSGDSAEDVFAKSDLLQYLNIKTKSANRGSKSRSSFANLYAIYILVEDYLRGGYVKKGTYSKSAGTTYTVLLDRQRELPFGRKLQNHALNSRLNEEFRKYFNRNNSVPVLRNLETNRYWFNENMLIVSAGKKHYNLAQAIIKIIDKYIEAKQDAFNVFIKNCKQIQSAEMGGGNDSRKYIADLIAPNVDARIFEIVSYAILKYYFYEQEVYFGFSMKKLARERLILFKTGRTNANDGGIDFVMKPLGRFFQVTETLDVKKYFLDIDKIERFPISFVIKSIEPINVLKAKLRDGAMKQYSIENIVKKYMGSIEEIINVPILIERFNETISKGHLNKILQEIILQSKVEFHLGEDEDDEDAN